MKERLRLIAGLTNLLSCVLAALILAMPALGKAQSSNAQDSRNWTILDPIVDGTDTMARLEYRLQGSAWVTETASYLRNWGSTQWYRNGTACNPLSHPYVRTVREPHTMQSRSNGTITLRMRWKFLGGTPSPAQVKVLLFSNAEAQYPWLNGFGGVNNGLDTVTRVVQDSPDERLYASGYEARTIQVGADGLVEVTLDKNAVASSDCGITTLNDAIWSSAEVASISVYSRQVLIELNGMQFKQKATGEVLSRFLAKWVNDHHDSGHIDYSGSQTVQFPAARPVLIEPTFAGNTNSATYFLSVPTVRRQSDIVNDFKELVFTGAATSFQGEPESYEWTPGPSGTFHCRACSDYRIPSVELGRYNHYLPQYSDGRNEWADFIPGFLGEVPMELKYSWPASDILPASTHTATRQAILVEPTRDLLEVEILSAGTSKVPIRLEESGGYRAPAGMEHMTQTGILTPPVFNRQGLVDMLGHVSHSTGLFGYPQTKAVSKIASVLGHVVKFVSDGAQRINGLTMNAYDPAFTWWVVNNIEFEDEPSDFAALKYTYQWEAYSRPAVTKVATVVNVFDLHGFSSRQIAYTEIQGDANTGTLLFKFYKNSQGGGGSSGGSSGGGG